MSARATCLLSAQGGTPDEGREVARGNESGVVLPSVPVVSSVGVGPRDQAAAGPPRGA